MGDQLGFADGWASPKLGRNAGLERLSDAVDWQELERLLAKLRHDGPGRPAFPALMMLKAVLLQQWYGLSDAEAEEAINDRVSFRRFLGLSLEAASPDHTTLCRFRGRLAEAGLGAVLFAAFERQLEARGLIVKQGTMVDATLIASPFRPGSPGGTRQPVDPDATVTTRKGTGSGINKRRLHYGYKLHIGTDQGSRLIRRLVLTPANVNDTVPADQLVCGDEAALYGDKAYAKRARRQALRAAGIKPRIMHKSWGGGPALTTWQQRHNRLIAPIRAEVEGVFATLKRWMNLTRMRYRGLAKNSNHAFLVALAYNMNRAMKLA